MIKKEIELIIDEVRCQHFTILLNSIINDIIDQTSAIVPLWHWLFTHEIPANAELGLDGHPIDLPHGVPRDFTSRLWAGSSINFGQSISMGQTLRCCMTTETATLKQGQSGSLAFVPVQIEIFDGNSIVLTEHRMGVYRQPMPFSVQLTKKKKAIKDEYNISNQVSKPIIFTEISLFRYSALIHVTHRIHYDYPYTTKVEGFPGLIIHGPLLGQTIVCYALKHYPGLNVTSMNVQAIKPNFLGSPVILNVGYDTTRNCVLAWAEDITGAVTMKLELYGALNRKKVC